MISSLALFPAVFIIVLMNQILEEMSAEKWLPISSTICLVKLQCPHYRRQKAGGTKAAPHRRRDDTLIFVESNGDIYSKLLAEGERFYVRGECVLCFECSLTAKLTNYGQSGSNLKDYRLRGDFIEFVGPGTLWYGNGRQDLLSNAYKLRSLLFCDNVRYSDPDFVPNLDEQRARRAGTRRSAEAQDGSAGAVAVGNYSNGRYGIIESFELRQRFKMRSVEKCLIVSSVMVLTLSMVLWALSVHFQPTLFEAVGDEIQRLFD